MFMHIYRDGGTGWTVHGTEHNTLFCDALHVCGIVHVGQASSPISSMDSGRDRALAVYMWEEGTFVSFV